MRQRNLTGLSLTVSLITLLFVSSLYAKDKLRMKLPIQKRTVAQPVQQEAKPPLELIQPNDQSRWCVEGTYKIIWNSSLPKATELRLEILRNTGANYFVIATNAQNTGQFAWTIPFTKFNFGQGLWKLKISTPDGKHKVITNFQIGKPLLLSEPQSNRTWRKGNAYDIKWMQGCSVISDNSLKLHIDLLDGNKQFRDRIAQSLAPGNQTRRVLKWTVPTGIQSGKHWIRVHTDENKYVSERSFTIADPLRSARQDDGLKLLSPNISSAWCIGSQQDIRWQSSLGENVKLKIELLRTSFDIFKTIAQNVPNTGLYLWNIDRQQYNFGQGHWILRLRTMDSQVVYESDRFSMGKPFMVNSPKSNYTWRTGSTYTIVWMRGCVMADSDNLRIKFVLLDSSRNQVLKIAESLPPGKIGNNSRKWTVPQNLNDGIYYIQILDDNGNILTERSFNISN
jgi:hypothetical protein